MLPWKSGWDDLNATLSNPIITTINLDLNLCGLSNNPQRYVTFTTDINILLILLSSSSFDYSSPPTVSTALKEHQ